MGGTGDTFLTIASRGTAEIRVRGSRFIGVADCATSEQTVEGALDRARRDWRDARHHCYAFRLGHRGEIYRTHDDGEPSGTAGVPILRRIDSSGLTDTVVVVTRYFGGTKLGRGGLVRAYGEVAGAALEAAKIEKHVVCRRFRVRFPYDATAAAMKAIESVGGLIVHSEYSDLTDLVVDVRVSASDRFRHLFVDHLAGRGDIGEV